MLNDGVYFIRAHTGHIKIGHSSKVLQRYADLQVSWPVPLELLAVVVGTHRLEKQLHEKFAEHRVQGEWFNPAPELLAVIDQAKCDPYTRPVPPRRVGRPKARIPRVIVQTIVVRDKKPRIHIREPKHGSEPTTLTARVLSFLKTVRPQRFKPYGIAKIFNIERGHRDGLRSVLRQLHKSGRIQKEDGKYFA